MVSPVYETVSFQLLQRKAQHALGNAEMALEFVEAECSVLGQRNNNKNAPSVAHA